MPRYLLETDAVGSTQLDAAVHLAAERFPEVAVEHCCTARDDTGDRALWVCRAPSAAHLGRWAEAARLPFATPRRIDPVRPPAEPACPSTGPARTSSPNPLKETFR